MTLTVLDLWYTAPLLAVAATGLIMLTAAAIQRHGAGAPYMIGVTGLTVAGALTAFQYGAGQPAYNNMVLHGAYGSFFSLLFLAAGLLTMILARDYLRREGNERSEFYVLLVFAVAGMMIMASAIDLIAIFLGIELMSLSLYVLAGFFRTEARSTEAALKYFLLGAFATGFLLYGIALIYGVTGTTNLPVIARSFPVYAGDLLFILGAAMLVVAFSFKVAAVPFHMWAPDVYEGAPTPVTGFMSTASKAAAFAVFVSVFMRTFEFAGAKLSDVIAVLAAISMVVGNVTAIAQSNVKRMLAYSSIAHAGYMLAGVAAGNAEGESGILFYLAAYTVMNIGAFGIVSFMEGRYGTKLSFDDYAGLSVRRPFVAALMSVFMFSLAGIPPFAGFVGKYYVFLAAVEADLVWLAVVGVLTSLVSVYYYLRLVVVMYFREGEADLECRPSTAALISVTVAAFFVLQIGVFPSLIVSFAQRLL